MEVAVEMKVPPLERAAPTFRLGRSRGTVPRLGPVLEQAKEAFFTPAVAPIQPVNGGVIAGRGLAPVNGAGRSRRRRGLHFGGDKPQHAEK